MAHSHGKEHVEGRGVTTLAHPGETAIAGRLLPSAAPLQLIDQGGQPGGNPGMGRVIDRPWVTDGQLTVRKVTELALGDM
jgi:hypothetical protein